MLWITLVLELIAYQVLYTCSEHLETQLKQLKYIQKESIAW